MSLLADLNARLRWRFPAEAGGWRRAAVILAALLLSAAVGYTATRLQMMLILAGFAAVPFVIILLRWPPLGILGILLTGLLVGYSGPGGLNVTILLVILLFFLWLIDILILRTDTRLAVSRTLPPIYALIALATLSFAMGQYPWFPSAPSAPLDAQVGGFAVYALSFIAFILVANQLKTLRELELITWAFIVIGGINIVGLAIPGVRTIFSNLIGSIGSVYWIWIIGLAYGQSLFNADLKFRWRALLMVVVVAAVYILFIQKFDNKSGWVPILFVIWVITALRSWQLGGLSLVAGSIGVALIFPQILESESYSLETRLELIPILWQIVQVNPLFGVGFGNYYFFTTLFSIRGWYVEINSHNNFLDVVAQMGFVGTAFLFWFLVQVALLGLSLRRRVTGGFEQGYVNGAIGAFAAMVFVMGLGDWVLPFVYNIGLRGFRSSVMGWVFLGGLVVIEKLLKEKD